MPSELRDEPHIYPGHSAHVEVTEGMSTPAEERGDLLIGNIRKHPTDCILDVCVSRILLHHPTFIGNRKQCFFSIAFAYSSIWSMCLSLFTYVYAVDVPNAVERKQVCTIMNKCNCTSHTSMLCIRGSRISTNRMIQHPQWEDGRSRPPPKANNKHISKLNEKVSHSKYSD